MNRSRPATPVADAAAQRDSPVAGAECLSDGQLEQLLAGRLEESTRTGAEQHLEQCSHCEQRLLELAGPLPVATGGVGMEAAAPDSDTLRVLGSIASTPPFPTTLVSATGFSGSPVATTGLDGFVELSFVGRGGSGTVYRARQGSLGRWVALKVLASEGKPQSATRAQREAQALASLNHPHVVTVHEAHLLHSPPFLVMEWVGGGSLQDRLATGPLSIAEVTALARQLTEGIAAVHALGVIHRDLKPANVLLAEGLGPGAGAPPSRAPLWAKITDFGLALVDEAGLRTTQEGLAVGTPAYMAPEQTGLRLGLGKVGPACDIHGVGAVLFAALTGRPPHEGETAMATLAHVAYEEAPWLRELRADVPVDLATIVAKCLRPLPGERYRSAWELREDLDRFGRGEPILARSYTPREQVRNWIRRHPTLAVTVGLTGTLLVATALGATYHVTRLRQNFFLLQSKQSEVESALKQAELATESERELRSDTVRQVAVAHRVMLNSLRHTAAISDDNLKLLNLIRSFYHQQLETATQIDGELAEILGEGLMVLSELESRIVSRPAYAEQDSGLLLQLADRHPQSQALVSQRAHMLNIRWSLFRQQGRSAEAQQALEEITRLATRYAGNLTEEPPPNLLPSLMGMLWNAGDLPRALQVVDAALQRERRRHASGNRPPESWQSLLALQSQRMGVMHELEWWPEAEATLLDWLRMSEKLQTVQPELEPVLTLGRLQMMGRHLQLAGEHLAGEQRESLLKSARALFTQLDRFATNPREYALIAMDWTATLESLPAGTIPDAELETTWEITRRGVARLGPKDIQGSLLVTSTSLRNRYATRALATGRFAEALQTARDGLALWENWPDKTARQYRQLCVDLLDVAARACRALDRAAEELHYLSRAEQLAPETERNAWQARLQNATREQGLDWPGIAEPVTQPE